jgi:hypothetical protein
MCFAGVAQYPSTAAVHSRCDGEDAARSVDLSIEKLMDIKGLFTLPFGPFGCCFSTGELIHFTIFH